MAVQAREATEGLALTAEAARALDTRENQCMQRRRAGGEGQTVAQALDLGDRTHSKH